MTRHVYPISAMVGDYVRAAAGFLPTAAVLAIAPLGPAATAIVAGFAALFAFFGLRTALRHMTPIETSATGVTAVGPLSATVPWADLDRLKLAYYSTRRDRRDGWMQLELRAGASTIRFDSRIDGFNQLVERAALAAAARGVELSAATAGNLEALGIGRPAYPDLAAMAGGQA
ncbi:MAG: hypothetical protein WA417_05565 [Stellaceae bacterium]|jgi:hypothetical protein